MKARERKWLSLLLALCMVVTMLPAMSVPAAAADPIFTDGQTIDAQTINSNTTWTVPQGVTVSVQGQITINSGVTLTLTGGGTIQRATGYTTGPLFTVGGTLSATNVVMNGQNVLANNAAIFTQNTGSKIVLNNVTLQNFASSTSKGGALCMHYGGAATLTNCTIQNNQATSYGGAIYANNNSILSISDSTFNGNKTTKDSSTYGGGALYIRKAVVSLNHVTFSQNTSTWGGAIYNSSYGTLTITGGSISGNIATKSGYENSAGIFHSSKEGNDSVLNLNGDVQISDPIYLDATNASKVVILQSALQYPLTLYCKDAEEKRVVIQGDSGYTVTAQDMARLSMKNDGWYFGLSDAGNQIFITTDNTVAYIPITIKSDDNFLNVVLKQGEQTVTLDYSETAGGYIGSVLAGTYDVCVGGTDTGNDITVSVNDTVFGPEVLMPHSHPVCGASCINHDTAHQVVSWTAWDGTLALTGGSYYLATAIQSAGDITITDDVNLCLNGQTLDLNDNHIKIESTGSLTICDCSSGGTGKITGGSGEHGGAIYVNGGTLTLYSGTITGNTATGNGGGVFVYQNGTFTMTGGSITDNTADQGGGVLVQNGTFTMTGGSINGNTAITTKYPSSGGGGVYVYQDNGCTSIFTMSGGSITNNQAPTSESRGGGVYLASGTFNMSGNASITDNTATNGGGVFTNSAFTMAEDASITDNEADKNGGGVYVHAGSFSVSGTPTVTHNIRTSDNAPNNVLLLAGKTISITNPLTDGTIGVTMVSPGVFTSGWNTHMDNADSTDYFTSDSGAYLVMPDGNGEVMLHKHNYTYTVSSDKTTITESCTCGHSATATISAPTAPLAYDGQAKTAIVTYSKDTDGTDAWAGEKPAITYQKDGESTALTAAPIDAGTYTAAITIGGQTARVEFTIAQVALTAAATANDKVYDGTTTATGTITLSGAVHNETPTATGTFTFEDANAGDNKNVNVTITLEDSWGQNYTLSNDPITTTANITAKPYNSSTITIEDIADQNYTGQPITPKPVIEDGDKTLVEGMDYDLVYSNNTDKGTSTVTIKFKGNYSGQPTVDFKIDYADLPSDTDNSDIFGNNYTETSTVWSNSESGVTFTPQEGWTVSPSPNGEYKTSITFTDEGEHTETVYVKKDNTIYEIEVSYKLDKTDPVVEDINAPADNAPWTDENVTVSFDASDATAGIESVTVTGSNGSKPTVIGPDRDGNYSFETEENDTYTVTVTDKAGNQTVETIVIDNIDKTPPTLSVSGGMESGEELALTVSGSNAGGSGVTVTVQDSSGTALPADETGKYTITEAGTYTVTATTGAGKTEIKEVTIHSVTIGGDPQLVVDGGKVTKPADPIQPGYTFDGWYNGGDKWNFGEAVTKNLDLTAKWTLNAPKVELEASAERVTYGTEITLTATATHAANDLDYTYEWYKDGNNLEGKIGKTLTLKNVADSGSYTVKVTATDGMLTSAPVESSAVTVTIAKADPVTVWPTASAITYGQSLSESQLTGGSAVGGTFAWKDSSVHPDSGSPSYTVEFTPTDADNYKVVEQAVTITVNKATLSPTVSADNKEYDGTTTATGTVALSGAVLNDNPTASGMFTFDNANAGTGKKVTVAVTLDGNWGANYQLSISELETTAAIEKKVVGLTWSGYEDLVYDGEPVSVTAEATGLIGSDVCTVTVSGGAETNAGTYTATATDLDNGNYQLPAAGTTQPYTIGQADGTASVTMDGWTYGNTPKVPVPVSDTNGTGSVTYRYTGTTNGGAAYDSADVPAAAGAYTVTATFAATQNHKSVTATADFTIAKKPVTGTWQGLDQVYGDGTQVSILLDGLVEGDIGHVSAAITGVGTAAGSYDLTAALDNYEITPAAATLTIQKKPVVITVTDNAVTVGGRPTINVPVDLPAEDYKIIYKDKEGNTVVAPTEPGTYEVWVEITDPNYRHPDGSSEKQVGSFTISSGAPTLYPVSFDGNGGSGTMADLKLAGGSMLTLPACSYTKAGSLFTGWLYGGKTYRPGDSMIAAYSNMTFTAQWQQTYGITVTVQEPKPEGEGTQTVSGAVVSLWLGANKLDEQITDGDGKYAFTDLLPGIYNLVVTKDVRTVTSKVELTAADQACNAVLPKGATNSIVKVTEGSPDIVVGNLDTVFQQETDDAVYTQNDQDTVEAGGKVEITFTADEKQKGDSTINSDMEQIAEKKSSAVTVGLVMDYKLEKTVTSVNGTSSEPTPITQSNVLLEVLLPLPTALQGKASYSIYRVHDGEVQELKQGEANKNTLGEYFTVSEEKTGLILHVKCFSTYAIGYTESTSGGSSAPVYAPSIVQPEHGTVTVSPKNPQKGSTVTITATPDDGYTVDTVTVTDATGQAVTITPKDDGTYTFVQPTGKVTITVAFRQLTSISDCPRGESCPMAPFIDADRSAWYHDGVHYCVENGLMAGTSNTTFAPNASTTRGMIVTILWRLKGSPVISDATVFEDVEPGDWYSQAVGWADRVGVVSGYGNGTFGPNDPITREQMAAMLWRYAGSPKVDGGLSSFTDGAQTSSWAQPAMIWAVEQGLFTGVGGNYLEPRGQATRAQAATILMRFAQDMAQ